MVTCGQIDGATARQPSRPTMCEIELGSTNVIHRYGFHVSILHTSERFGLFMAQNMVYYAKFYLTRSQSIVLQGLTSRFVDIKVL
jgi:hypothetical protein